MPNRTGKTLRIVAVLASLIVVLTLMPITAGAELPAQSTYTLSQTGLAASYTAGSLVDVAGKTQTEINTAVESAIGGLTPINATLTTATVGAVGYDAVRILPVGAGSNIQLWAKDTSNNWYDINVVGWGPATGFPLPASYDVTTPVYPMSNAVGEYTLSTKLVDVNNSNTVIAQATETVNVIAAQSTYTLSQAGLAENYAVGSLVDVAGKTQTEINTAVESAIGGLTPINVTLTTATVGAVGYDAVRILPVGAGSNIQLWAKDTSNNWYDINVVGWGPAPGFPLPASYDVTTPVHLMSNAVGEYTLCTKLVDVNNSNTVIAEATGTAHVVLSIVRDVNSVTQDPGPTGGDLSYIFAPDTKTLTISNGEVPYVTATGDGFPPSSGNWVGVAIKAPEGFEGDIQALSIDGNDYTGDPILSADEQTRGELWYYFLAQATDVTHTLVIDWSDAYLPETITIRTSGLTLEAAPPVLDTVAPSTPTGLTEKSKTSSSITIGWVASTDNVGVDHYVVEMKQGSTTEEVSAATTECTKTGLSASTAYTFRVKAVDAAGNASEYSEELTVTTSSASSSGGGGGGGGAPASNEESEDIDASTGGSLTFDGVTLEVPANALPADATLTVEQLTSSEAADVVPSGLRLQLASNVFEISTDGTTTFNQAITIRLPYDPAKIAEGEQPVVHYYDETTGEWVAIPTSVECDGDDCYAVIHVNHLTKFTVFGTQAKVVQLTIGQLAATVDGAPYTMDAKPYLSGARTLVPLRFVSEALGANVEWIPATQQVRINDGANEIVLTIGSKEVSVNGVTSLIDSAPELGAPGRTFVPLRFVGETLGAVVDYQAATKSILITRF